ncbi:MAG TPA: glucan phosphorylase, partial [Lactococcus sp.]|nr:glucan phosphorylase [Lactococcus sp.]
IGKSWRHDLVKLEALKDFREDTETLKQLAAVKLENKKDLAALIKEKNGIEVNPEAIFDVQIKRLHAYKRQLLNVLHILKLYFDIKDQPDLEMVPRVFIFGAKAQCTDSFIHLICCCLSHYAALCG